MTEDEEEQKKKTINNMRFFRYAKSSILLLSFLVFRNANFPLDIVNLIEQR